MGRRVMTGEPDPRLPPPLPHQRHPPVFGGDGCSSCPIPNGWFSLPGMPVLTPIWANSKLERSGVAKVKCRPAFASMAQKTLAVPQRSYSLSRRASRPGAAGDGGRKSACRVAAGWAESWFFIRYPDSNSHIRLRVSRDAEKADSHGFSRVVRLDE